MVEMNIKISKTKLKLIIRSFEQDCLLDLYNKRWLMTFLILDDSKIAQLEHANLFFYI